MGATRKRHHDRYTLEFKKMIVKLANNPAVMAKEIDCTTRRQAQTGYRGVAPGLSSSLWRTSPPPRPAAETPVLQYSTRQSASNHLRSMKGCVREKCQWKWYRVRMGLANSCSILNT